MRQKLDFSLLVVTSFIVVLALEPGHYSLSQAAAARESNNAKSPSASTRPAPNSSGNPLLLGSAERVLRDLKDKGIQR